MSMSFARFTSIMGGMSSSAKKVYDVVPIAEPWSIPRIVAELQRNQVGIEYKVIAGCLDTLTKAGLVSEQGTGEQGKGEFMRAAVKPHKPHKEPDMSNLKALIHPQPKPAPVAAPLDRLDGLAQRVAAMAAGLKELANDIADAAVDIQAQIDSNEANVAKMRQLQQLLKSLEMTA